MVAHVPNAARRALSGVHRTIPTCRLGPRHPSQRPLQRRALYSSSALAIATSRLIQRSIPGQFRLGDSKGRRSYVTLLPRDIAVLGGGLTGLTTAYYLTRFHPHANITLYEEADRLGGWIDTERVTLPLHDGGATTISLERGARAVSPQSSMARWEDFVLFDLIDQLNLYEQSNAPYAVRKDDPVLSNRYIYYPDHLVSVPGPPGKTFGAQLAWGAGVAYKLLTEPVFKGAIGSLGTLIKGSLDTTKKRVENARRRPAEGDRHAIADFKDLSMGDYFQSRLGSTELINNVMSALIHGIWGGDVWKLSMLEGNFQQSLLLDKHSGNGLITPVKDHDYFSARDIVIRNESVLRLAARFGPECGYIGFNNGFSTLTDALANALKKNPKVAIKTGTRVTSIRYEKEQGKAEVTSSNSEKHSYDKVISSLYSGTLAKLTGDALPALKNSTAVTIQIVNLWYPNAHLTSRHPGFGYLIPQSVPVENNPHAALGVIFDSDRDAAAGSSEVRGTKLTVMLGGHYWDYLPPESWPDAKEAANMATDTVQRQLGIPEDEPVYTSTKVCRECIPQHLVGHRARMERAHAELDDAFRGTLAVVGSSYTAPGVLPSLKAARDVAMQVSRRGYNLEDGSNTEYAMPHVDETGLGRFVGKKETYQLRNRRTLPYRFGNTNETFD